MDTMLFIFFVTLFIILVFSRAEECYYCGSRSVTKRSRFKTLGICAFCKDHDEVIK